MVLNPCHILFTSQKLSDIIPLLLKPRIWEVSINTTST